MARGEYQLSSEWPRNLRQLRRSAGPRAGYHGRWAAHVPVQIRTARGTFPCILEDISVAGARLNIGAAPVPGTHVFLLLDDYGTVAARIAWRRNAHLGLNFSVRHPALLALAESQGQSSEAKPS
jgi:PilZ domain